MANRVLLKSCRFSDNDDLEYLRSDVQWVESRGEKLSFQEKTALAKLVFNLHDMSTDQLNPRFLLRLLNECFDRTYMKSLAQEKRKHDIKAIFTATVVRELILREETVETMKQARETFFETFPFVAEQEGTNTELTWLNRYARALKYLMRVLPPAGNKQTYLNVGANLEGSSVFTEYITGGSNRPETQRRVDIYVEVTEVTPKKRINRIVKKPKKVVEINGVRRGRGRPRKNPLSVVPITPSSSAGSNYIPLYSPTDSICYDYDYNYEDTGYVYGGGGYSSYTYGIPQVDNSSNNTTTDYISSEVENEESLLDFELLNEEELQEFVEMMGVEI